jgi:hypothetical protein
MFLTKEFYWWRGVGAGWEHAGAHRSNKDHAGDAMKLLPKYALGTEELRVPCATANVRWVMNQDVVRYVSEVRRGWGGGESRANTKSDAAIRSPRISHPCRVAQQWKYDVAAPNFFLITVGVDKFSWMEHRTSWRARLQLYFSSWQGTHTIRHCCLLMQEILEILALLFYFNSKITHEHD